MKDYCVHHDIYGCELRLEGCTWNSFLTFAHRHKRRWYYGQEELLTDRNEWRLACINCHEKIEYDRDLTEEVFQQ